MDRKNISFHRGNPNISPFLGERWLRPQAGDGKGEHEPKRDHSAGNPSPTSPSQTWAVLPKEDRKKLLPLRTYSRGEFDGDPLAPAP